MSERYPENDPNLASARLLTTPEKAVTAFMNAWERGRFDAMGVACQRTWKYTEKNAAAYIPSWFGVYALLNWGPMERHVIPENPPTETRVDFKVPVTYRTQAGNILREVRYLRVISEAGPFEPTTGPGSYWGVNPLSALRTSQQKPAQGGKKTKKP